MLAFANRSPEDICFTHTHPPLMAFFELKALFIYNVGTTDFALEL